MKSTSLALAATLLLGATPLRAASEVHTGACSTTPPTISVSSVTVAPAGTSCPTENDCFKVDWAATPNGQTLTGFKVDLNVVSVTAPSTTPKTNTGSALNIPGSARSAIVKIFMSGTFKSYDAKVTATYSGCAAASKAGSF